MGNLETIDLIMLTIVSVFVVGLMLLIGWMMWVACRTEIKIMETARDNPELRDAASVLWCAPKSWRKQ